MREEADPAGEDEEDFFLQQGMQAEVVEGASGEAEPESTISICVCCLRERIYGLW